MNNNEQRPIKLDFKKEKINALNEQYEDTLNNVYAIAVLSHQVFARLGYQIKIQEQILEELKKINKDK